ncbi:MAG: response regulator transcription factor [Chloroflexi bacterium]|nr:response regulator transcription factor [Chloroflexota bacterium]
MAENFNSNPIRVLIVDDHPIVRRGLQSLLSSYSDIQVVGEAENAATTFAAVKELNPDVILLDIQMTGLDGIELTSRILQTTPQIKIIILTAYNNEEYVLGAFRAGAYAYLLKNSLNETVVEAIRQVHQGRRMLSPSLMDQVLRQLHTLAQSQASHEHQLSPDDIRVLALIANGATNEEIAREVHWSESTVKRRVEEIMATLGARNRAQAVSIATKEGLI